MALRVLFDTTRLAWRARRRSPTGIDRVVLAYLAWLKSRDDISLVPVALAGDRLTAVPLRRLEALRERCAASSAGAEDGAWRDLQTALHGHGGPNAAVRRSVVATPPGDWLPLAGDIALRMLKPHLGGRSAGDIYLNVAHTGLHRRGLLSRLARQGVAPVLLVHDLIPLTHPEFCTPGAGGRHGSRIAAVLDHAALVIANSQSTAEALRSHAAATGRRVPPIEVAWLGVEDAFLRPPPPSPAATPYFVCVGTIEARKNLAFLLTLWRRLAEEMGPTAPHLVLVGRRGWENEAVIDHLERSPAVRSLVHEVADLGDDQLACLIGGARALLAPSLAEGFDLPPVEALTMGAPVIASDIAVHREVARAARLIDPLDGPGWIAAIKSACMTRAGHIPFKPPTWAEHFRMVGDRLGELQRPRAP